jgi:hypothetical protein
MSMEQKLAKHGMFSWFELQTTDVAAAKAQQRGRRATDGHPDCRAIRRAEGPQGAMLTVMT